MSFRTFRAIKSSDRDAKLQHLELMNVSRLTILVILLSVSYGLSQGQVTFGNNIPGALVAPVYGVEMQDPINGLGDFAYAKTGNTAGGIPAGTQVYYGTPGQGLLLQGWSVSFWAAPPWADPTRGWQFIPSSQTVVLGSGGDAGFWPTTPVTFDFLPSTGQAAVQVRVWDSRGGTIPVSQAPWGDPSLTGASAIFTADIGGLASGFRSFSVGFLDPLTLAPPVPEPSKVTFCALVTLLLGWRVAWRQKRP